MELGHIPARAALLLLGLAHPQVKAFIGHVQPFGHINYTETTLGHLLDRFSLEFG